MANPAQTTTDDAYMDKQCWKHYVKCPHTCLFTSIFLVMRKPEPDTDECRWAITIRPDSFQWLPPSPDGQLPGEHRSRLELLILSAFNCKPPACFKMKLFPYYDLTNFYFLNVVSVLPLLNLVNNTTLNGVGLTTNSRELSQSQRYHSKNGIHSKNKTDINSFFDNRFQTGNPL